MTQLPPSKQRPIELGPQVGLPLKLVTEKTAIMGRTGSGKSNAAMKAVEEMLDEGAQVIVVDPVGVWWSLRVLPNLKPAYPWAASRTGNSSSTGKRSSARRRVMRRSPRGRARRGRRADIDPAP